MAQRDAFVPPLNGADSSLTSHSVAGLFERYHQEIYRLCLGMLEHAPEAEDAAQEVFLRAHRAWARYDPERAAPRTWLGQIAMNYCRSVLRRRRVAQLAQRVLGGAMTPAPMSDQRDLYLDIRSALNQLDIPHRSVVLLRYYLDLSCPEIADILGIPEGTVRSRLFRARHLLQSALEERDK